VAVLQQLDTALTMLVECVSVLSSDVDSMARLHDSLRAAAMTVDVRLLSMDVAAVREWEKMTASTGGSSAVKVSAGGSGSHRKQKDRKQLHRDKHEAEAADDNSDPSFTAAVSPYTLLLTLEDTVYILTALHQRHTAALAQLQVAVKGGGEQSDNAMREALDVLSDKGNVDGSMLEEWLSIIRRACKM